MKILITGTNRGLGLEFAKQYLERNEEVVATCRKPEKANKLKDLKVKYPERLTIIKMDVSNKESIDKAYEAISEKFPAIDLLVNNAGIKSGGKNDSYILGELTEEDMEKVFKVNSIAPVLIVERFLDLISKGKNPKIINITSFLGSISAKTWVYRYSYCASKTALNMFSKLLSLELKEKGIIVIPLHPGHVQTDLGGYSAPLTPKQSISGMIQVIDSLTLNDSGKFLSWDGKEIPW